MKKLFSLQLLLTFVFIGCNDDDDTNAPSITSNQ